MALDLSLCIHHLGLSDLGVGAAPKSVHKFVMHTSTCNIMTGLRGELTERREKCEESRAATGTPRSVRERRAFCFCVRLSRRSSKIKESFVFDLFVLMRSTRAVLAFGIFMHACCWRCTR